MAAPGAVPTTIRSEQTVPTPGTIPILMYHDVSEPRSPISVSPAVFADQMRWLHEHQYRALPLGDVVHCLRRAEPLPARSVVITFDDGFESVSRVALPVLARFNFPATVFVVTDFCGRSNDWPSQPAGIPRRPLLTWQQIRDLDAGGVEIGVHSATHASLDVVSTSELQREVIGAQSAVEDHLGHAARLFAYPYGRIGCAVSALVANAFDGACTTRVALASQASDVLALPRVEAQDVSHPWLLSSMSGPWFPRYLAVRGTLRSARALVSGMKHDRAQASHEVPGREQHPLLPRTQR